MCGLEMPQGLYWIEKLALHNAHACMNMFTWMLECKCMYEHPQSSTPVNELPTLFDYLFIGYNLHIS